MDEITLNDEPLDEIALNDKLRDEINDILGQEIVREFLIQSGLVGTDREVEDLWAKCDGNPWNAPILLELFKLNRE